MRVVVFGATGPTGRLVLRKALAAGHEVTAYARSAAKLEPATGLHVIVGELTDVAAIRHAVEGHDAVISVLGPTGKSKGTPVADGMRHIVQTMAQAGVRRLIATATTSAQDRHDRFSVSFWLAMRLVKAFAGNAYDEILGVAEAIRTSTLDWTLVRLPMLSDKPCGHPAATGYVGDPSIKLFSMSREPLAEFLVAQLNDVRWIGKSPAVSNGS
ncbi:NAD(P)-dependent oxidoreductase [Variovorax sp.]|uniref:NAD(P)-dependent oxidoreductase n=1 Tax=Variovorax sp. TaxID=1871043 RepID=UPI002D31E243|nr:NAD(P)H-binding protein [Variovorax sp.]HYP85360.1 NAD(P)H-binding protein [Variovorax sp.]